MVKKYGYFFNLSNILKVQIHLIDSTRFLEIGIDEGIMTKFAIYEVAHNCTPLTN